MKYSEDPFWMIVSKAVWFMIFYLFFDCLIVLWQIAAFCVVWHDSPCRIHSHSFSRCCFKKFFCDSAFINMNISSVIFTSFGKCLWHCLRCMGLYIMCTYINHRFDGKNSSESAFLSAMDKILSQKISAFADFFRKIWL